MTVFYGTKRKGLITTFLKKTVQWSLKKKLNTIIGGSERELREIINSVRSRQSGCARLARGARGTRRVTPERGACAARGLYGGSSAAAHRRAFRTPEPQQYACDISNYVIWLDNQPSIDPIFVWVKISFIEHLIISETNSEQLYVSNLKIM